LIGGSVGLAARRRGLARRVIGVGRRPEALRQAQQVGAIDEGLTDLAAGAREAQLVVFCTPVDQIAGQVLAAASGRAPGTPLPHLLAAALAGLLPPELHELTATGFRDTTRVAAGDPALWTGIFLQNRAALLDRLGTLQDQLARFKTALMTGDAASIDALLAHG